MRRPFGSVPREPSDRGPLAPSVSITLWKIGLMHGPSPALMEAAARFAEALPVHSSLAEVAEKVLAEIQREIDAVDAQILRFSDVDVPPASGADPAVIFRQGARRSLQADRTRWRKIVDTLRQVPERPVSDEGYAYVPRRESEDGGT